MKNLKKALIAGTCSVLLVAGSVAGTMAYLTSTDTVTNTFTVGNVAITLDEAPVNNDGQATTGDRVKANSYNLLPGHEYDKDPVVHFKAKSEDSWLFVKVVNNISSLESDEQGYSNINAQILANGWVVLDATNNPGIYYRSVTKSEQDQDFKVFEKFTVDPDKINTDLEQFKDKTNQIVVNAYAIQKDGFTEASKAWAEVGK